LIKAAAYAAIAAFSLAGAASAQEAAILDCTGTVKNVNSAAEPMHVTATVNFENKLISLDSGWHAAITSINESSITFTSQFVSTLSFESFSGVLNRITGEMTAVATYYVRDTTDDRWRPMTRQNLRLRCKP
jgi:hypothetical protein